MHRTALALALVAAASLAGCADGLGSKPQFTLEPTRIGWNVTEVAVFTLGFKPGSAPDAQSYTVDPVFAVQALRLDTGGVGGDFETERPEDLGFELVANGTPVREHRFDALASSVDVRFRIPEELKDDAYTLEVVLFQAGSVESGPFRVNRP